MAAGFWEGILGIYRKTKKISLWERLRHWRLEHVSSSVSIWTVVRRRMPKLGCIPDRSVVHSRYDSSWHHVLIPHFNDAIGCGKAIKSSAEAKNILAGRGFVAWSSTHHNAGNIHLHHRYHYGHGKIEVHQWNACVCSCYLPLVIYIYVKIDPVRQPKASASGGSTTWHLW